MRTKSIARKTPHIKTSNLEFGCRAPALFTFPVFQVLDTNGALQFVFGEEGFADGQFKYPRGVAVDPQGFILIADSGNNRIQVGMLNR